MENHKEKIILVNYKTHQTQHSLTFQEKIYCPSCGQLTVWKDSFDDYYVGCTFHCTSCGSHFNLILGKPEDSDCYRQIIEELRVGGPPQGGPLKWISDEKIFSENLRLIPLKWRKPEIRYNLVDSVGVLATRSLPVAKRLSSNDFKGSPRGLDLWYHELLGATS